MRGSGACIVIRKSKKFKKYFEFWFTSILKFKTIRNYWFEFFHQVLIQKPHTFEQKVSQQIKAFEHVTRTMIVQILQKKSFWNSFDSQDRFSDTIG